MSVSSANNCVKFTNCRILKNAFEFDDLWVENSVIIDPRARFEAAMDTGEKMAPRVEIDCRGNIWVPGYIDVQVNGGFGIDFSSFPGSERVAEYAARVTEFGVTSFLPTIVSRPGEEYPIIIQNIRNRTREQGAANVLGVHLEGPFLNTTKSGAHQKESFLVPVAGLKTVENTYGSLDSVKIVTLAPELAGTQDVITGLSERGIVVSLGHSMATLDQGIEAVQSGATFLTHLFNAMRAFHHRDPGLIGLVAEEKVYYGIIADGVHSHPASVKMSYKTHPSGCVLVTDGMEAAGLGVSPGRYKLGESEIEVDKAAFVLGSNRDVLAGSVVTMDICVRNYVKFTGCSREEAIRAATLHPARLLGIQDKKGTLEYGSDADLILVNDELEVLATLIGGVLCYESSTVTGLFHQLK